MACGDEEKDGDMSTDLGDSSLGVLSFFILLERRKGDLNCSGDVWIRFVWIEY